MEGQSATFSLVAAGTEPLSYQWQRWNGSAWSDINGATQGSYTTPACTMAENGAAFQCVVSNALDSVTSEPAELTVTSAPTLNPEAFYKFEETAGSTAADSSGNGNTGTVFGAVWTDSGKIGRALDFQSGNAHVAVPASASTSFSTNRMTVAGWVYLTSLADPYPTLIQRSNAAGNWLDMQIYVKSKDAPTSGRPVFRINFDGDRRNDADEQVQANMALAANTWYFIACTYDGTALRFYIDGTLSGTTNKTGGVIPNSGRPIWIGANDAWGEPYRGRLDEICLFNRALSQTEIQALMAPGPQGPSITQQPTNQTVTEGQSATFNIAATGDAPLAYQWQRLSGATWNNVGTNAASYICPPCTIADNGAQFRCVVSNTAGDATSNIATLTVNAIALPPSITQQPTNQTVTEGQSATFNIAATGDTPLSYQWQRLNGAAWNNVGTNATSYVCPPCTIADNGAQFRCVVSNTAGDATSNIATLTVNAIALPPSITQQPANQTVTEGQSATFNIAATGDAPLSYQWQRLNGATWNNVGTNAASYVCPPCTIADNGAQFRCVVSNTAGDATSNIATLTVNAIVAPPSITQQPANQTVTEGQSATFSITATGEAPLSYQWQRLSGATWNNVGTNAASYVCPPCTIADNGAQFRCVVSNTAGDATSNIATLTVNAIPGPSPQGYWKFSEGTGSTTADFSGNGNNGSIVGAAWTTGRVGPALDFQTGDAHVAVPAGSSLDFATNRMTVACWVYPSSTTAGWSTIIQRSNAAGTWMDWQIYAKANDAPTAGRPVFRFDWDGDRRLDADEQVQADIALATNTWQFIACTYDGAALRFYIDGVLRGTTNKTGGIIPASTKPIWIGANDIWGEPYRGRIDEVRLFNQALTQTEIQSLMAVPNTASITINKMTLPAGASGFAFTGTNGIGDFVLDDADSQTFGNLPPGDYSITEHATSGWYLDSATCTGSLADGIAGGLLVHLGVSDQAICTFTNVEGSAAIFREHFNTNFTVGSTVGQNPNWYDAGGGPVVNASNGLGGTRGLAPASNIFSWKAHPFNWNAPEFSQFVVGMDFQSDSSGQFDDDRVGWMTTITSVDSANFFGVQLDTVNDGGIVSYWRDASGTRVQEPIVPFTSVKASTWYRLMVVITKLTPTSASVDVAMQELDAGGNPVGAPVTGSIVNTSNWSGGAAPGTDYFTATTAYPAFKNHSALSGAADNAYAEIVSGPLPTGTLTVNIVGNGSVSRNPDKTEYEWGEQVQLTAVPVAPQTFVGWSGGLTGSTNPATVVMLGNMSVTATFAEPQPPQILVNPANQSVYVGQSATFSVQASGTAPLHYQWQRDDVDIAGANAASYVCPPCDLDDNGATFCCVVSNAVGSVTSNDAVLTVTDAPPATFRETFNTGFTVGSTVGAHADWYDASGGPVVTANVGVGGSVGLAPANNIFTWNAHPFNWNDSTFVGVNFGMDFQSDASGQFDDDRVGWMTTIANVDSANNFGVQLDTVNDGGLVSYWRDASGTRIQEPIIPFTSAKANTWYRVVMAITKLTATSARIDVSMQELDASGNPVGTPLTGSIADTSNWSGGAGPAASYFASATYYPAYKNYTNATGAVDNAYAEIFSGPKPKGTLTVNIVGNGSVSRNPDKAEYDWGEVVELTATPVAPMVFMGWSGALTGSANPATVTMQGNTAVTATFATPNPPQILVNPTNQSVYEGRSATFSVQASGTAPLQYQWQKNHVNISGANAATYVCPPCTLADNGATFRCVVSNTAGSATSNDALLTVTTSPASGFLETFNTGFTLGSPVGTHAEWYDAGAGPNVTAGAGVAGSVGLGTANNIMTWEAHPFNWNDSEFVSLTVGMDFQSNASGQFDDDRIGWMTTVANVDSTNFFGVQLDSTDGGIVSYWRDSTNTRIQEPIVPFTSVDPNTWYHLQATITRLSATSARIDVSLQELDANGDPVGSPITGTLPNTANWSAGAPPVASYFTPTTMYPAYKNFNAITGGADNAYAEVTDTSSTEQFAFVVVSDLHTSTYGTGVAADLQQVKAWVDNPTAEMPAPEFMVVVGDFPLATQTESTIDSVLGSNFVWFPTMGNHESDVISNFNYVRDSIVPTLPWVVDHGPAGSINTTYSWEYGNAHFVVVNGYWDGTTNLNADHNMDGNIVPALRNWVQADLAATDKTHRFVFCHEGLYPENRHIGDSLDQYPANRDAFVTMLDTAGVGTFFNGHEHYYHHDVASEHPLLGNMHQVCDGEIQGPSSGGDPSTIIYVRVNGNDAIHSAYRSATGVPFALAETWTITKTPPATYALNVSLSGSGGVQKNPDKSQYNAGEIVQLTAVPAAGWDFDSWSGDVSGSTNPISITMDGNKSVTATFSELPILPSFSMQPVDQTVTVGEAATFSVQASGTAPLQYQWKRDDVDIAGANAASYVCPPCTLDDNGATFCCVVSNAAGSVTSNDAVLTVTDAPPAVFRETFNTGFTVGSTVGAHADWYDSSGGPVITANVGVGGSVGLAPAGNIFTWNAHPFNWNDSSFVGVNFGMDFQSNASGQFDDDRVGWMTTIANVDSANNFGVQLDTVTDGGLVTYWRDASGTRIQQPIIPFTSVKANTWYRLVMNITKLTSTSARIDVSLQELDASGNPVGTPLTGSIADTSNWSGGAGPAASYFASATYYPAYKNYTNAAGAADNAYAEVTETNNPANYTLNVSLSGSGSVQKNPDKPQYSAGEIVQLTAVPAAGWDFDSWSGDVSGSTNPISITMDGNKSVIATFSEVPTVPSFSIQPVNQTVTVGEAATFSVAASGTQPIAYQWMKWNGAAWEDVQNETGASFTTAPTTLADDGARFCCEATNIMGTTTSNEAVLTVSPEANKALDFGGTNSFVTFGNNSALGLATFTLECWFRRDGTGVTTSTGTGGVTNAIPLVTKGRGEADGSNVDVNYFMGIRASDNVLAADFEEGVGGTTLGLNHPIVGTTPIANNTWYHAAATYDGSKWQLFLNGRLESELIVNLPPRSDSVQHSAIGSALTSTGSAAGYFDGAIDEVRIWNYARTPAEIAALVNVPVATAQPGLVARWGLNEGSGAAVASTAGITANGSISGSNYAWVDGAPFNLPMATAPHPPELIAPADGAQNAGTSPQLEVRVTDPDADDMDVTFYGRAVSTEPDFTIAVLPDTQFYSANMNGGTAAMFTAQTQWIADNREEANIAFVAHVGDVSQNGDSAQAEWVNASNAMYLLDGLVPYGLAMGNHDQPGSYFNQYFGVAKFSGQPFYGGHYGTDNDNNYELFSAGGLDFIVIHLEYDDTPDAPVLAWADGLLKANPSRRGILVSHWLSEPGTNGAWGAPGQTIYNDLKDNPNLFLMLCGHRAGEGRRSDVFDGNTVHTLLADYQERTNGGNGWMRLMEFSPANNEIRIKTYSPTLGQYETDADSQFTLPYDLQNGSFEILGANLNVASGATTGIAWTGLADNASYQWFAVADDGTSIAASPSWTFSTGGTPQPTGVLETFDSGFTLNSPVGNHAEWYDAGGGPQIQSGIGLSGSNGVATSGNIFSWDAHPFTWGDAGFESLTVQMDFQSNGSGQFDDDRIGWMTTVANVDSANNFGVQLDTADGGIVTYWRTATGTRIQTPIAPLSGIVANTWYRAQATFTKLTATSARIDVALQQLDSSGNAVGTPITGTVSDTSLWAAGAPAATYFSSAAQYPAFKNYTAITGAADNAYIEISAQP